MTYDEVVEEYGYDESVPGSWMDVHLICNCGEEMLCEPNMELDGAAKKEPIECEKCHTKYKVAYINKPQFIIEQII